MLEKVGNIVPNRSQREENRNKEKKEKDKLEEERTEGPGLRGREDIHPVPLSVLV